MEKYEVDQLGSPSFCRHIFMEINSSRVKIHPHFLKHIKEEVPDTATLKGPWGGSWPVKVRQTEEGVFLVEGWEQFRRDHSISCGSRVFVLFTYFGNWRFGVELFGLDAVEMEKTDGDEGSKAGLSDSKGKRLRDDSCDDSVAKPGQAKSGVTKTQGNRFNWKCPQLAAFFLDKCKEEVVCGRTHGGNLSRRSWKRIRSAFKEEMGIDIGLVQLENRWFILKGKYQMYSEIIAQARSDGRYDPGADKVSWDEKQWEEYVQVFPDASMFRDKPLEHLAKMKALFQGSEQ